MSEVSAPVKHRHRLILGKFQVVKVEKGLTGLYFWINLGNSVAMRVDSAVTADVKLGDLLTLYTEVLADADAGSTPIQ